MLSIICFSTEKPTALVTVKLFGTEVLCQVSFEGQLYMFVTLRANVFWLAPPFALRLMLLQLVRPFENPLAGVVTCVKCFDDRMLLVLVSAQRRLLHHFSTDIAHHLCEPKIWSPHEEVKSLLYQMKTKSTATKTIPEKRPVLMLRASSFLWKTQELSTWPGEQG